MKIIEWTWDYLNSLSPAALATQIATLGQEQSAISLKNENFNIICHLKRNKVFEIHYERPNIKTINHRALTAPLTKFMFEGCFKLQVFHIQTKEALYFWFKKLLQDPVAFITPYIIATKEAASNQIDFGAEVNMPEPNTKIGWAFPKSVMGISFVTKETPVTPWSPFSRVSLTTDTTNWYEYTGIYRGRPTTNLFLFTPQHIPSDPDDTSNILWVKPKDDNNSTMLALRFIFLFIEWSTQNGLLPAGLNTENITFQLAFTEDTNM